MLTGSRLVPGTVKTYGYYSISEMIAFCGHVAKHAQTGFNISKFPYVNRQFDEKAEF